MYHAKWERYWNYKCTPPQQGSETHSNCFCLSKKLARDNPGQPLQLSLLRAAWPYGCLRETGSDFGDSLGCEHNRGLPVHVLRWQFDQRGWDNVQRPSQE